MNVFFFTADSDRYQNLSLVNEEEDWEAIYKFNGTPIGKAWQPLRVEINHEEDGGQLMPSDCPSLFAGELTLSLRAVEILKPILEGNGELLPLDSDEGDYFIFNVTRVVDALDENLSEIVRFPDGKRVMDIKQFVFMASRLKSVDIFRLPQFIGVFVTDNFVQKVRQAKLAGFSFEWVWGSEQRSSSPLLESRRIQ